MAGNTSRSMLAARFDFTERHSGYYGNAASWFGLVEKYRGGFRPTLFGTGFAKASHAKRLHLLLQGLARSVVFRQGLVHLVETGTLPSRELVEGWLDEQTELTGTTIGRRAQTVLAWLAWASAATSS